MPLYSHDNTFHTIIMNPSPAGLISAAKLLAIVFAYPSAQSTRHSDYDFLVCCAFNMTEFLLSRRKWMFRLKGGVL